MQGATMGEYADMMLDGTMCSSCGEYLGGDEGYPVTCASCAGDDLQYRRSRKPGNGCPKCAERFPDTNLRRKHLRDVHGLKMMPGGKLRPIQPPTPPRAARQAPAGNGGAV